MIVIEPIVREGIVEYEPGYLKAHEMLDGMGDDVCLLFYFYFSISLSL